MHTVVMSIQAKLANVDFADKAKLFQIILAEAMANKLKLTADYNEDPLSAFKIMHRTKIMEDLSKVNEYVVIDLDEVLDLIYKFWLVRYSLVFRPNDRVTGRLIALASLAGDELPGITKELITKYKDIYFSRYEIEENQELRA